MNKDLVTLFLMIATGATASGLILASGALVGLGLSLFLIPLYIGLTGDKFF